MNAVQTDVAIIGAGTAGMTAYRSAKKSGKRAVLIESGPYGTTCARVGCMPSKLLIAAAEVAHSARAAEPFGIHIDAMRIDGVKVMDRVRRERDRFVGFVIDDIKALDSSDLLKGHARFLSDTQLQLDDGTAVHAQSTVIATGSSPVIAGDFSHLGDRLLVNDDVFDWKSLPQRVLVVGSGVIGLELGQALHRLGVQTCIINRSDSLGGLRDPRVRTSAAKAFHSELDIRPYTEIKRAERVGNQVRVELCSTVAAAAAGADAIDGRDRDRLQTESVEVVDYILMAVGRSPNLGDLGLENTSVKFDDRGRPVIDPTTLQLAPAPLFVAGDATGRLPVLHEAADEGYIAGANAAGYPDLAVGKRRAPLAIVFSDPQLAQVGMHYDDLPRTGVVTGAVDFSNQGRSRVLLKNYGLLHVYAEAATGRFLGAEMAGPHMEHIAHLLAWSFQQELSVQQMLEMPFYHPVIEEGLRTALRDALRQVRNS